MDKSSTVSRGATGTATTMRSGACMRTAWIAAIIEEPVARPSSIRITTWPLSCGGGRSPRYAFSRRDSSCASRATTASKLARSIGCARSASSLRTCTPPLAMAPMAYSGCEGAPSLRTSIRSRRTFRAGGGNFISHRDTATGQGQDDHLRPVGVFEQGLHQASAGFGAVEQGGL
ncbi:hypothetical protein D3C76_553380 [compost metagenome]